MLVNISLDLVSSFEQRANGEDWNGDLRIECPHQASIQNPIFPNPCFLIEIEPFKIVVFPVIGNDFNHQFRDTFQNRLSLSFALPDFPFNDDQIGAAFIFGEETTNDSWLYC